MLAQVYFDGVYRIDDGPWQEIEPGKHISSTEGDVILRGNFYVRIPEYGYVEPYDGSLPIAFYVNHVNLTFYEVGKEPLVDDMEDPIYGQSACGAKWTAHTFTGGSREPIEIRIHNPHKFGNDTAVDEVLENLAFWADIEFEKDVLNSDKAQRTIGLFFLIVSLAILGIAFFATLIHLKNSKIFWLFGLMIAFAGLYFTYSTDGISFWSGSVVTNTTVLGFSMMFYMLFFSMALVYFLKDTKKVATVTVVALGVIDGVLLALPLTHRVLFYDTWLYWGIAQALANGVLLVCLVKEFCCAKVKERWLCIGSMLPMIAFYVDAVMIGLGLWKGGVVSACIFVIFFVAAMIVVLKIIPHGINTLAKAQELETEKIILNAQLTESRVSTMMSQIRPHFIYNTLGSIEQLCFIDPAKAGELVHNFAKYLRGNFGELDNPKPILMSQEMDHVHYYVSIEHVRFPDMTFSFEMHSDDFYIPALTIQPIVENAIKHGLMKLPQGGTIRVISYETDTHYCVSVEDDGAGFDTRSLQEDRTHVGIRNIRGRLKAMVNGELEIESTGGVGTKVRITIPKEVGK